MADPRSQKRERFPDDEDCYEVDGPSEEASTRSATSNAGPSPSPAPPLASGEESRSQSADQTELTNAQKAARAAFTASCLQRVQQIGVGPWKDHWFCKACYPKGLTEAQTHARGLKSCFVSKRNSTTITRHFECQHPEPGSVPPKPPTRTLHDFSFTSRRPPPQAQPLRDLVRFVCTHDMSFQFIEEESARVLLRQCFPDENFKRKQLRDEVLRMAAELRERLFRQLRGRPALICVDGGTIHRKTYLNVTLAQDNQTFFYTSIRAERLLADWISAQLKTIIDELREKGVIVVGICADNASNMQKAAGAFERHEEDDSSDEPELLEEDSDYDEPSAPSREEAMPTDFEFPEQEVSNEHFCFNVRCWAHTLQLLLKDAQDRNANIRTAFAVCARVCHALHSRELLALLRKDDAWKEIPIPTETRWNSSLRAMWALVSQHNSWSGCIKIELRELALMRLTLLVCTPIAWATDVVQGDVCDAPKAMRELTLISERLSELKTLAESQSRDAPQLRQLKVAVEAVEASIRQRSKHFESGLVKVIRFLDPNSTSTADERWCKDQVTRLAKDCNLRIDRLAEEFVVYQTKGFPRAADFWKQNMDELPTLYLCHELLCGIVVTEASVERSFQSQKQLMRPKRNRLEPEAANAQLFVKWNFRRLCEAKARQKEQKQQQQRRSYRMSLDDWRSLAQAFIQSDNTATERRGPVTRNRALAIDAAKIVPGCKITYQPEPTGPEFEATVLIRDADPQYWMVRHGQAMQMFRFNPLAHAWAFAAE